MSNVDKTEAVLTILSNFHREVLESSGLTTPRFETLTKDSAFNEAVYSFARANSDVIDALASRAELSSEDELDDLFCQVQDMTNIYKRDILPDEARDRSAQGNLSHPYYENRRIFISGLIKSP